MKNYRTQQSGFSLVETLVAITILLIVIVGPMTISSTTARSTSFSSEQVQAFFLAQEGVEIVQKIRDNAILADWPTPDAGSWNSVFDSSSGSLDDCVGGSGCGLELSGSNGWNVFSCSTNSCQLYYDANGERDRFTYNSSYTETPFIRRIEITEVTAGREVQVRSIVEWRTGSLRDVQSVEVETYLFNVYGS